MEDTKYQPFRAVMIFSMSDLFWASTSELRKPIRLSRATLHIISRPALYTRDDKPVE